MCKITKECLLFFGSFTPVDDLQTTHVYGGSLLVTEFDHFYDFTVDSLLLIALSLMSSKVTHQSWK